MGQGTGAAGSGAGKSGRKQSAEQVGCGNGNKLHNLVSEGDTWEADVPEEGGHGGRVMPAPKAWALVGHGHPDPPFPLLQNKCIGQSDSKRPPQTDSAALRPVLLRKSR